MALTKDPARGQARAPVERAARSVCRRLAKGTPARPRMRGASAFVRGAPGHLNVAVTLCWGWVIWRVQRDAEPLHAPPQPTKLWCFCAVAVKITLVPDA
jgi:hypothetical protein